MPPSGFALRYTGIRVRDLERFITFYRDLLGPRLERRGNEPEHRGAWAVMADPGTGQRLELNWYADDSPIARPYPEAEGEELDHLGFETPDVDAAVRSLAAAGFPSIRGPARDGDFLVAFVKDPDGIWVELFQRLRPVR